MFKKVLVAGLLCFVSVYGLMSFNTNYFVFTGLFIVYGFYAAATESVAKAWLLKSVDKESSAAAIGTFSGFQSIALLLASTFAGVIWYNFGSMVTLLCSAAITFIVVVYIHFKTE